MFRALTGSTQPNVLALFRLHPVQVLGLMEELWGNHVAAALPVFQLGHPLRRSSLDSITSTFGITVPLPRLFPPLPAVPVWDHIVYALMIENTGIYEVFNRVLEGFVTGERLGVPDDTGEVEHWLRNTEQVFYRDSVPSLIGNVSSFVRPDLRATRRNPYWRLAGVDLVDWHNTKQPYPYVKAPASNMDFVAALIEFISQVFTGYKNRDNSTGEKATDDQTIASLAEKLQDDLLARRKGGSLSREEFNAVCMMSWLHLTVSFDTPIITALGATGGQTEGQRLARIGSKVDWKENKTAQYYFELADDMSTLLWTIETGAFNTPVAAQALYLAGSPYTDLMLRIKRNWEFVTAQQIGTKRAPQLAATA